MSTLKFVLSYNNEEETLQLPVNPDKITVTTSRGYEDVEVTQLGEYTIIGNMKLRDFSFSSFFPREYNESYCEYSGFLPPWENVKMIERWLRSGRPIRFKLSGQIYGDDYTEIINEAVTIRSFEYAEEGGAVGDISFTLELKEYVFIEFKRVKSVNAEDGSVEATTETSRPDNSPKITEYTVTSGDTLVDIAARAETYGDPDAWRKLYEANIATIGANPNLILPGQKLVIA